MGKSWAVVDGGEAVARVAFKLSEVIAIYPITPSTTMGELSDAWSAAGQRNLWGTVPCVVEMQSEGGAAGAVHGALQTGALATTFTASQGLLLMIPNMYKIAGELTAVVFHVAARAIAAQGLSIFGDQSDVMAVRATGFGLLASNSVQEAQDLALIAHASTLAARIPFIHFFDGMRTSHEINKISVLDDADLRFMIDDNLVHAHRERALSPEHPFIRGTSQNPDVYFQARETVNPYYQHCPGIVQTTMDRFAERTGRSYHLFDYVGAPDAERVVVLMGSGAETAEETARVLVARGEKVGVVKVHLYRPFSVEHFLRALPPTVKTIAVLDRTKEPGSAGEPLFLDIVAAVDGGRATGIAPFVDPPRIIGGRYGLASKEFTPAMVKAVFDEMARATPKSRFTIGIDDDVTFLSLKVDPDFSIESDRTIRCVFWGLGSDGTVGANKNSIKILGEETDNQAQGYFVYDSKKSGSVTISHLRFGPDPIHAPYLIDHAHFIACHQFNFLEHLDVLECAAEDGVFLLNSIYGPEDIWDHLPRDVQWTIIDRKLRFYVVNAQEIARQNGMGARINTIMQTCFFAISGVLPREAAIAKIKESIRKTYGKRGETVVQQNFQAVDQTLAHLYEVTVPAEVTSRFGRLPPVPAQAPSFVRNVLGPMIAGHGDRLPVSALPSDGTYPSATTRWEKRSLSTEIPAWVPDLCIQCGKCAMVCPHAVIRQKVYDANLLQNAPPTFLHSVAKFREFPGEAYSLQVAPEDCTGCGLCIEACPVKDKTQVGRKAINMVDLLTVREPEKTNWDFFVALPEADRTRVSLSVIKNSQLMEPLFEFSGACAGCGETPYIKLVTQLFGDRTIVANATGCSSIFGGNLPTTPWALNREGRGPAWSNSLFEDDAEFGYGMRLTLDKHLEYAAELLPRLRSIVPDALIDELLAADQSTEKGIQAQRARVDALKNILRGVDDPRARQMLSLTDALIRKSVWIIGGDGWAYDIGFGGLDHVLASGRNVNILILDTEVYSNTGGQASKSTPRAAVARFAAKGKGGAKKDLGLLAMSYGSVYVAQVAMGANDQQTLTAFVEAEAYDGPSLIIAYSHCIAHGYDMRDGLTQQRLAMQSGYWPLYRYNPKLVAQGKNPFILDSKDPTIPLEKYAYNEARYSMLKQSDAGRAEELMDEARHDIQRRWNLYRGLAALSEPKPTPPSPNGSAPSNGEGEPDRRPALPPLVGKGVGTGGG